MYNVSISHVYIFFFFRLRQKNKRCIYFGLDIYSCAPRSVYKKNGGTSMAAGVAAAVLSYYPNLTAKDLKAILMKSSVKYGKNKVAMPGNSTKKVKFKKLSVMGGVVNLYEALKMAEGWPGSGK
jgi:cell wall-associated protease